MTDGGFRSIQLSLEPVTSYATAEATAASMDPSCKAPVGPGAISLAWVGLGKSAEELLLTPDSESGCSTLW